MKVLRSLLFFVLVFSLVLTFVGVGSASEAATKEECIEKTKAASQMITDKGLEATLAAINDKAGPFVWKDSYVFCISMETQAVVGHINEKLIGKNLMGIKDSNGKMFFAEMFNMAKDKGDGWVSYMWPKPGEKTPSPKTTYVLAVPGASVFVAAGIYE